MDAVFKALADENRKALLDHLYTKGGQTLGELCEPFAKSMSLQAVMKHLAILEGANLLVIAWKGREKLHFLNPIPIHDIQDRWIRKLERQRIDALSPLSITRSHLWITVGSMRRLWHSAPKRSSDPCAFR